MSSRHKGVCRAGAAFVVLVLLVGCQARSVAPPPIQASLTGSSPAAAAAPQTAWRCLYQGRAGVYAAAVNDGAAADTVQVLPADVEIQDLAVNPRSRTLALSAYSGPCLLKDLSAGKTVSLVEEGGEAGSVAWSPDGATLAYGKNGELWLYGDGAAKRLTAEKRVTHFAWSPDGTRLAFACRDDNDQDRGLWLIAATGGEAHRLVKPTGDVFSPDSLRWSPDGAWIAFGHAWEGAALAFVRADGTGYRSQIDTMWWPLVWKQDGSAVLYEAMKDEMTSRGVRSCTPEGRPRTVLNGPGSASYDLLPSGEVLIVHNPSTGKGSRQVNVRVIATASPLHPTQLSQVLPGESGEGALAPDGSAVAVVVETTDGQRLWLGQTKAKLTQRGAAKRVLGWMPE